MAGFFNFKKKQDDPVNGSQPSEASQSYSVTQTTTQSAPSYPQPVSAVSYNGIGAPPVQYVLPVVAQPMAVAQPGVIVATAPSAPRRRCGRSGARGGPAGARATRRS